MTILPFDHPKVDSNQVRHTMSTQVRSRAFETNSSSTHSLTVVPEEILDFGLSKDQLRTGVIEVTPRRYGWEWRRYYTLPEKLAYLITQANGKIDARSSDSLRQRIQSGSPNAQRIIDLVEQRTGCRIEFVPEPGRAIYGFVDGNSQGIHHEVMGSDDALAGFLFSPNSYVETGNDNYDPNEMIQTDRGPVPYYTSYYAEAVPGDQSYQLTLAGYLDPVVLKSAGREDIEVPDSRGIGLYQLAAAMVGSVCTGGHASSGKANHKGTPLNDQQARDVFFRKLDELNTGQENGFLTILRNARFSAEGFSTLHESELQFTFKFATTAEHLEKLWEQANELKAERSGPAP